jgi:hypothetical protein
MDNSMERIYTVEKFSQEKHLERQSAINLLSKMKKKGLVHVVGGGKQKRLYKIFDKPTMPTNGFYDLVNKYSPEKLVPQFKHYIYGKYAVENAIIDGIKIRDIRTKDAIIHLFRHVKDWKTLFRLAEKENLKKEVLLLYNIARKKTRVKKMPERYR